MSEIFSSIPEGRKRDLDSFFTEEIEDALYMWRTIAALGICCQSEEELEEWNAWRDQIRVLVRFRDLIEYYCLPGTEEKYLELEQ